MALNRAVHVGALEEEDCQPSGYNSEEIAQRRIPLPLQALNVASNLFILLQLPW